MNVIGGYTMVNKLKILVESRIRGNVYVRFGGEYMETYYSNIARHRVLSLHYIIFEPFLLQLFKLMDLHLKTTDPENPMLWLRGIPQSEGLIDTIRERVLETRKHNQIVEIN